MEQHSQEHVFKGMPRLRYRSADLALLDARQSPYYWWWAYLRLSKDYWLACNRGGWNLQDPRLQEMYRDFGNVYEQSFDDWWRRRGARLFAENVGLASVRLLDHRNLIVTGGQHHYMLLEIPLYITERTIIKQVRQHLRTHPDRSVYRRSSATRQLAKLKGLDKELSVLEKAYKVYRSHQQSRIDGQETQVGKQKGTKSLYQIGKEEELVKTCMPMKTDNAERARQRVNGMKVAVSRMLIRAKNLIENAAIGVFPCVSSVSTPIVWNEAGQRALKRAVEEGYWRPLFDESETLPRAPMHRPDQKTARVGVV